MINAFTVSLFGHRELSDAFEAESRLEKLVRELIRTKEYVEFLVGHNGDFDTLASSVIRREMSANDYGNASLNVFAHIAVDTQKQTVVFFLSVNAWVILCENRVA